MDLSLALLAVLCILAITFIGLGLFGRQLVLSKEANPCKMTYSSSSAAYIPIPTQYISPYRLLQYQHASSGLHPHPVLFIPGSIGSYDQIRSFASEYSHNKKQLFQYFTIDFNKSMSAFHSAIFLHQAAFVNEAIHAIFTLYASKQGNFASNLKGIT